jgi:hypothetical protein
MSNPKSKLDLNVENYTITELFEVLEADITDDKEYVLKLADVYIKKFTQENNHLFVDFFSKVKSKLEEYFSNEEEEDNILITDDERREFYDNVNLLVLNNDNEKKEENYFKTKEYTNPNLKKTTSRMLVIDSQFRQVINDENPSSSTDFTMDLSEPLHDLVTMKLFSVQIPYTWYTIDEKIGTNLFYIDEDKYIIEPGNYTPQQLVDELNITINGENFSYDNSNNYIKFYYREQNGKISIESTYNELKKIVFYNFTDFLYSKINNNLGHIMGFQKMEYIIDEENKIRAEGIVDLYGPKYLLIVIDDYNQNHVNSGLINIYDNPNISLKLPSYFDTSIPTNCNNNNVEYLPQEPRQLTQKQLYSLNQIQENKDNFSNYRQNAPVTTDVFAFMPIKHSTTGLPFVEFGGSLQSNVRNYFGPVNINRLRIRLMDDKGNIVNLNNANWSFGIVCETLQLT